jgi:hypothetical protein
MATGCHRHKEVQDSAAARPPPELLTHLCSIGSTGRLDCAQAGPTARIGAIEGDTLKKACFGHALLYSPSWFQRFYRAIVSTPHHMLVPLTSATNRLSWPGLTVPRRDTPLARTFVNDLTGSITILSTF